MSFLRGLFDQANPFDGGKTFNTSNQKPSQAPIVEYGRAMPQAQLLPVMQQMKPQVPVGQDPKNHIPYSAHTKDLANLGNIYVQNPTDPRVTHMDPALFGYPADGGGGANPNDQFRQQPQQYSQDYAQAQDPISILRRYLTGK